uniref:Molybdopterin synthase sulfur carrier subunit n=1 Tax=Thermofilum pendens TaxID=2269 RepID=A0A7C3SLI3_THEPE
MLFASLREKYGHKEITVECDGTLRDAVLKAAEILGPEFVSEVYEDGQIRRDRIILVNGRHVQFINSDKLEEEVVISIFPPIAGG